MPSRSGTPSCAKWSDAQQLIYFRFDQAICTRTFRTPVSVCRACSCDFFSIQKGITCHIGQQTPLPDGQKSDFAGRLKGPTRLLCTYYVGDGSAVLQGSGTGPGAPSRRVDPTGVDRRCPVWMAERLVQAAVDAPRAHGRWISVRVLRVNRKSYALTGQVAH